MFWSAKFFCVRTTVDFEFRCLTRHRREKGHHGGDDDVDGDAQVRRADILRERRRARARSPPRPSPLPASPAPLSLNSRFPTPTRLFHTRSRTRSPTCASPRPPRRRTRSKNFSNHLRRLSRASFETPPCVVPSTRARRAKIRSNARVRVVPRTSAPSTSTARRRRAGSSVDKIQERRASLHRHRRFVRGDLAHVVDA